MKLKFIALNALLVIAIVTIAWQARVRWREAQTRRAANLTTAVKPVRLPPLTPTPKPQPAAAAAYADVANKDLFTKDRNPVVVVEAPKVEPPRQMPPLPVVYGVLGLPSGTRALMAEKKSDPGMRVHVGDTVGEFKIVSLDPQNVTFEWNSEQISRKIDDLIDRSIASPVQAGAVRATPVNGPSGTPKLGADVGAPGQSERACAPNDNSPAGTVVDGFKKTLTPTPFGAMCRWVPAQ